MFTIIIHCIILRFKYILRYTDPKAVYPPYPTTCGDEGIFMKKVYILAIILLGVSLPRICFADAPHKVGGFLLGGQMTEFSDRLKMDTLLPLRHSKFIHEIETIELLGFKNGLLWVGNCADPGRIVRIRLKYENPSKKFYQQLLKRYKKRFGDPSEWKGDPFHIVIAWKWSFVDKENNRISLVLQHNTRDEDESIGNSVKLTMWNLIEDERECYDKKTAAETKKTEKKKKGQADWEALIPQ